MVGRCPGSTPNYMNLLCVDGSVLQAWEYPSIAERDEFFSKLYSLPDRPKAVVIYKGLMRDGQIILEALPANCTECSRECKHKRHA
jgi:hypothetical protein